MRIHCVTVASNLVWHVPCVCVMSCLVVVQVTGDDLVYVIVNHHNRYANVMSTLRTWARHLKVKVLFAKRVAALHPRHGNVPMLRRASALAPSSGQPLLSSHQHQLALHRSVTVSALNGNPERKASRDDNDAAAISLSNMAPALPQADADATPLLNPVPAVAAAVTGECKEAPV